MTWEILEGDRIDLMRGMPAESVQCVVTSPPYYGLRDYGMPGQIGLKGTLAEYVEKLVAVFAEVHRVLRPDGVVWLNLGDSYAAGGMSNPSGSSTLGGGKDRGASSYTITRTVPTGYKPKDLLGVPWMVAFALRAAGWYLRAEIVWAKPNPMPESVRDRPTRAHEQVFLLAKQARYYYDADAIREASVSDHPSGNGYARPERESYLNADGTPRGQVNGWTDVGGQRNKRSVWSIPSQPFAGAHFATFPTKLVEPMVLAGCPRGGVVLDPFAGSGTVGVVCRWLGRSFIGLEMNPEYAALARQRILADGAARPSEATVTVDGQLALVEADA